MTLVVTLPTPGDPGTSGTWGTTLNTAITAIVAAVNSGGGGGGGQGAQGNQGFQGAQGSQGFQGSSGGGGGGSQGFQGFQGTQGFQGSQGVTGAQGFQGNQGFQGPQGAQGSTGAGTQGVQGNQGLQGSAGSSPYKNAFAYVIKNGSNYEAHNSSTDAIIGSASTDAGSVINGALTAANSAGGGMVEISCYGQTPITTPIVMPNYTGLKGSMYQFDWAASTLRGSYLKGSGLTSSQAVISAGTSSAICPGISIVDLGVDGGGTGAAIGVSLFNCAAAVVSRVASVNGTKNFWNQSSIAPNGGGFGTRFDTCMGRLAGQENFRDEGTGATDGALINCRFTTCGSGSNNVYIASGGWLMTGNHLTGTTACAANLNLAGGQFTATGNYFDSASQAGAYNVICASSEATFVGNFFNNPVAGVGGGIQFGNIKGNISHNTYITSAGVPFAQYTGNSSAGVINSSFDGVIMGNMGTPGIPVVDNAGNPLNDNQTTTHSYIGMNRSF